VIPVSISKVRVYNGRAYLSSLWPVNLFDFLWFLHAAVFLEVELLFKTIKAATYCLMCFIQAINIFFLLLGHPQFGTITSSIQWAPMAVYLRVKRPEREADHTTQSFAEVKYGGAVPPLAHISSCHSD
jgi:hypothetical protein